MNITDDSAKFFASPDAYAPRSEMIANYTMGYSTPVFSPTGGMKISAPDLAQLYDHAHERRETPGEKDHLKEKRREMQALLTDTEKERYGLAI